MAEVTVTKRVDDLDGTDLSGLPADKVRRVQFAVEGCSYQLDLTAENAALFDEDIARWVAVAKRVHRRGVKKTRRAWNDGLTPESRRQARVWAQQQGLAVGATGRLSREVIDAWREHAEGDGAAGVAGGGPR
ncbi:Lsr2 family protein, partial [Corynebacterium bovis]